MKKQNNNEENKCGTTDFLPSDGAPCCASFSSFGLNRSVMRAIRLETPEIPPEDINWWRLLKILGKSTKEDDDFAASEEIRLKNMNLLPDLKDFSYIKESMIF